MDKQSVGPENPLQELRLKLATYRHKLNLKEIKKTVPNLTAQIPEAGHSSWRLKGEQIHGEDNTEINRHSWFPLLNLTPQTQMHSLSSILSSRSTLAAFYFYIFIHTHTSEEHVLGSRLLPCSQRSAISKSLHKEHRSKKPRGYPTAFFQQLTQPNIWNDLSK